MKILTGNEHFTYEGMPAGILLNDFWAWSSSDLLNNTLRGALAEFLVASAIGVDTSRHVKTGRLMIYFPRLGEKSRSNALPIFRAGTLIVFLRYSLVSAQPGPGILKMTSAMK